MLPITDADTPRHVGSGSSVPPVVWLVNAYRAGEQSQLLALAEALGWPWIEKQLTYRQLAVTTNLFRGSGLSGIFTDRSSPLEAPWPDLIISAGMRNEPVCRWIRQQSGGRSRIVHLGRPWADPERFDLVITTPQYRLPQRDNILHNTLPLNRVNPRHLAEARQRWEMRFGDLPQPRIAVIAGGNSGPYTFGCRSARRLINAARQMADARGGSLLVTSSARTAPQAINELAARGETPGVFYQWRPGDGENPYFAYLAMADEIIVTADSISMLSEACATGKKVYMFDLGSGRHSMGGATTDSDDANDFSFSALAYRALMRWGWQRLSRDITLVHQQLVESGRASWLGTPSTSRVTPQSGPALGSRDLHQAVVRVRALLGYSDHENRCA